MVEPNKTERTIFCSYRGSHAHGTFIPNYFDDVDYLLVDMPKLEDCFGAIQSPWAGKEYSRDVLDQVTYEFRHFVSLLAKGNPNVLSTLWMPKKYIQVEAWPFSIIKNYRNMFRTRQATMAFGGYAYGQMKRMTAFQKYEGYMGAKRKALVDEFGFDVKNAAHLLRILRMGTEFMQEGELIVERKDADQLKAIKQGKLSHADVQKLADTAWADFEDEKVKCTWADRVDSTTLNNIVCSILKDWFKEEWRRIGR